MSDVISFLDKIAVDPMLIPDRAGLLNAVGNTDFTPEMKKALLDGDLEVLAIELKARQDLVCGIMPAEDPEKQPDEEPEQDPQPEPEQDSVESINTEGYLLKIA
ncbi:hypothetical protein ABC502_15530 [Alkalimonas sp. NCh-2]|uniref:hypothetical protein n=1 Tax=Alkalimonas sp. NCh-2 TaxID=3144846 RepID=UPI0031F6503F